MAFPNFATPHCHSSSSLDSASTPEEFAKWELEHETGALTVTDHGTLAGARKIYDTVAGKKFAGKVTPILGLEAYFRDDDCPILQAHDVQKGIWYKKADSDYMIDAEKFEALKEEETKRTYTPFQNYIDYHKYYHLTMHFRTQKAYETAVRLLSFADARAEKWGSETKPLFSWKDLEEIGAEDTVFCSGCLIGMVQRHLAFGGRTDLAEAYYTRLRSLVKPGSFFVEVFPHICDRNWDSAVVFTHEDGTETRLPPYRTLKTDRRYNTKHGGLKAKDLTELWETDKTGHGCIREIMVQKKFQPYDLDGKPLNPKPIVAIKFIEQFLMNECTAFSPNGDLQKPCNEFLIQMAQKYGDKILISDDSHFVQPDEKIVQDVKLLQDGNWRFANSYHRQTSEEAWRYFKDVMNIPEAQFESWIANSREWSGMFKDFKFTPRKELLPVKFYPQDTLAHTMRLIQKHGRQGCLRDPVYYNRLRAEIDLLHRNGKINLLPYKFIDEEVVDLYQRAGDLTGPGRGSAAGLLLCYLLEITHVDPIRYGLSMDRFMTQDRIKSGKMPDIDQDLPHRDLLVDEVHPERGWLVQRFGDHVVQISTDMTIRMRQGVLDVHRMLAADKKVPPEVAELTKKFQKPPQGINDRDHCFGYDNNGDWVEGATKWDPALMEYVKRYPKEWEIVVKCLGISRGKSRHACAFIIANEPVHNFIPLTSVGGVKVTQPTAAQVESSGGLKMDFLIVNSLKDIGGAIKLIQQRSGDKSHDWTSAWNAVDWDKYEKDIHYNPFTLLPKEAPAMVIDGKKVPLIRVIPHKGKYLDIWDLPEYQPVFRNICEGNTASVFQFGTPGAIKWLRHFNHVRSTDKDGENHKAIDSIEALAAFTALDRPGPLDAVVTNTDGTEHNMLVEFARRARGEPPIGNYKLLDDLFPETYGVFCYQEQLTKLYQIVGQTTGAEADEFRVHISKKQKEKVIKDKAIFMKGAVPMVGETIAEDLWSKMETFSEYGFNKSHAVCYVIIGYACAFLKHYYPLEWWTAVMTNAKKSELEDKFWRHVHHMMNMPDIKLSTDKYEIVNDRIQAPLGLLKGLGPAAQTELDLYRPVESVEDLFQKIENRRVKEGTTHTEIVLLKNGTTKNKVKIKKARTALDKGKIHTLIVSGAMDSLFPKDMLLLDKLQYYINVSCKISGNLYKKGERAGNPKEKIDDKYMNMNALKQFQVQKEILPVYYMDLFPIIAETQGSNLAIFSNHWRWKYGEEFLPIGNNKVIEHYESLTSWRKGVTVKLAVPAYVMEYEKIPFHGFKERAKIILDVEGNRLDTVKWPSRETGKLEGIFQENQKGAVVMAILAKWTNEKKFQVDDLILLEKPLGNEKAAAEPEQEEFHEP